ncbi:translation initiation factor IF-2, partial [bacterium]|nr:translation initiation factor IF-2 [bacterium]
EMTLLGKPSQINQKQQRQRNEKKDKDFEELAPKKVIQKTVKKATPKKNVVKQPVVEEVKPEVFEIAFPITIGELASILSLKSSDILMKLLQNGRMLAVNHSLDKDLIFSILDLFEIPHEKVEFKEDVVSEEDEEDDPRFMVARPPVVTILGHVDHGKTSLLDAIRKSNVTAGEAGGITQKIGAYVVEHDSKKIVFLDTPGHEAFTAMRARGAQVTDIAVLVVAADDGVMPQTIEAINHAKAAKVPIIVAINKIDKPGANPERVKQQLSEHGLIPEDWGGDVICVPVSAKAKMGIDDLLEMITLVADIQELKANPRRRAYGVILESRLDKGLGCMATVLVQKGTLKPSDSVIAGLTSGKVRVLINERGERVKKATPSIPVEIVGLTDLPNAGDILRVVKDDKMARQISDERQTRDRERHLVSGPRTTLQDIFKTMSEGEKKQLDVLIKADSNGSVEAIKHSLAKLPDDEVKVNVIHGAVGAISESDVLLARASNSLIIGFNIKMEANIKKLADQEKVAIRNYDVIYRMIEDIQAAMKGMLEPEYESVLTGTAEVRQLFKASKVGVIAGSYVSSGKVMRNSDLKIYRNKKLIHEGKIESLKRFKDDVREVIEGFECGITVENFNDIQVGDTIEAYIMKEKVR